MVGIVAQGSRSGKRGGDSWADHVDVLGQESPSAMCQLDRDLPSTSGGRSRDRLLSVWLTGRRVHACISRSRHLPQEVIRRRRREAGRQVVAVPEHDNFSGSDGA